MSQRNDQETFSFLITDVARLLRAEFDRRTSKAGLGLTPGEARTLSHAARAGLVRQTALAERMGLEAMTLSNYLDQLEERNLIRRTTDPADGRAKLVGVTQQAQSVLKEVDRIGTELRADISALLGPEQLEAVRNGLNQIRSALIGMRPECTKSIAASWTSTPTV